MTCYSVAIVESGSTFITVEAENREAAEEVARGLYEAGEVSIDPMIDASDVTFTALEEMRERDDKLTVLMVKAGEKPESMSIDNNLSVMQKAVGGYIEVVPLDGDTVLICNEEGKIHGLPLNRAVYDEHHRMTEIIAGDFFICNAPPDREDFTSLTEKQLEKYTKTFNFPQKFIKTSTGIHAVNIKEKPKNREPSL